MSEYVHVCFVLITVTGDEKKRQGKKNTEDENQGEIREESHMWWGKRGERLR